jgi:Family of unknown function (DUF5329)
MQSRTHDSVTSKALIVLLLTALVGGPAHAAELNPFERQKINYLIASVETLQGAQFVRNGKSYDAKAAADHLRLKLRAAGSRVTSADDFIRLCASVSSITGLPYQIRFSDGRTVTSEEYLRQQLAYFAQAGPGPP